MSTYMKNKQPKILYLPFIIFANGINIDYHPCEWFDYFMPMQKKGHDSNVK